MLIAGGRVVDPRNGIDALLDVRVEGDRVAQIGERLELRADEEWIDAVGAIVAPGFIDMHVHLRDPGFPEKETLASGTRAAVRGGFSAVACMPNTQPPLDDPTLLGGFAGGSCRVYPVAALTRGRRGEQLLDYAALAQAGAVAFSDDGDAVMDARVLRDAARAALTVAGPFISHAEDARENRDAVMHAGDVSRELGLSASPSSCEETMVARDLQIARETGKAWHVAHVSSAGSLALLRADRARGGAVTCEATPHHLYFTDETVRALGAGAKVNPPLRTQTDARALRDAVRDGTIDALASDHAPHTDAEKSGDIARAAVGFSGLEIAVGAYALALPDLPLARFVALLSCNPARILRVPGGCLSPGAPADVTIFADRAWRVDPSRFASKGRSTPFAGCVLPRAIVATIVGGRLAFHAQNDAL